MRSRGSRLDTVAQARWPSQRVLRALQPDRRRVADHQRIPPDMSECAAMLFVK
jgi:hypothetical protein